MSDTEAQVQPQAEKRNWSPISVMDIDEARRYIYHLQYKLTNARKSLAAKEAIIEHMKSADSRTQAQHIVNAIEQMIPFGAMRRL